MFQLLTDPVGHSRKYKSNVMKELLHWDKFYDNYLEWLIKPILDFLFLQLFIIVVGNVFQ